MAVTTTLSTSLILKKLRSDFKEIKFRPGQTFKWSPHEKTVFFGQITNKKDIWSLFHELAHGVLEHCDYNADIELLKKESEAWKKAVELGAKYGVIINIDYTEDCLDSYRDWLHRRSLCPNCNQTGVQSNQGLFKCINCQGSWNANDARLCALRRYLNQKP